MVHLTLPVDDFSSDTNKKSAARRLIIQSVKRHQLVKCDEVILACNTAHIIAAEVQGATGIVLNSLIENVQTEIRQKGFKKIGIVASPTTIKLSLFGRYYYLYTFKIKQA